MAPLSNYPVIPEGWAEHHRPVAAGTMTADAVVRRPGGAAPYPPDPDWDPAGEKLWEGKVRVQELKRQSTSLPADQPTYGREYLITFPMLPGAPLPAFQVGDGGDLVRVAGFEFVLQHPMAGSLLWEHDYVAWLNHTQQGGTSG